MLHPEKVRARTQIEMFEHKEGREVLKLRTDYEEHPVWNGMIMHAFTGLLLFIILAVLVVLAAPDWFTRAYEQVGNVWAAVIVAVSMAVFSVMYSMISDLVFRVRFHRLRSTLCGYHAKQRLLERIEQEQDV